MATCARGLAQAPTREDSEDAGPNGAGVEASH